MSQLVQWGSLHCGPCDPPSSAYKGPDWAFASSWSSKESMKGPTFFGRSHTAFHQLEVRTPGCETFSLLLRVQKNEAILHKNLNRSLIKSVNMFVENFYIHVYQGNWAVPFSWSCLQVWNQGNIDFKEWLQRHSFCLWIVGMSENCWLGFLL